MSVPVRQQIRVGAYILKQRLRRRERYPLVLMLEPLFRCNLACAGCGKIDYPDHVLNRRLSVADCIEAAEECGAPVVSIPGGEPLLHKEIGEIVAELIKRKRFVYPVHERAAAREEAAPVHAEPVPDLHRPSRRAEGGA